MKKLPSSSLSSVFGTTSTIAPSVYRTATSERPYRWLLIGSGGALLIVLLSFFVVGHSSAFSDFVRDSLIGLLFGLFIGGILLRREQYRARQTDSDRETARRVLTIDHALFTIDLDPLLQRFAHAILQAFSCRGVGLLLLDRQRREMEQSLTVGQIPAAAFNDLRRTLLTDARFASLTQGPVVCNSPEDIRTHFPSFLLKEGARKNLLLVPIQQHRAIGFLFLADKHIPFSDNDIHVLTSVSVQAAAAIEHARLFKDMQVAENERQALLRALMSAHEQERKRVAEEWHQRFGDKLFQVLRDFRACHELIVQHVPESKERFEHLAGEIDSMAALVRSFTNELHPLVLDDFGFVAALREYVASMREQEGFQVTVRADESVSSLPTETNLGLFRILQEALLNIRKHAQANHIEIAFAQEHSGVSLLIKDDGQGFNPDQLPQGHYGLLYMRERAEACGGTFRVVSAQGQGTEIRVDLPRSEKTIVQLTQREQPPS